MTSSTPDSASLPSADAGCSSVPTVTGKAVLRDAIGLLAGILVALCFIAATSFEVRYITSKPSSGLASGEIIRLADPKGKSVTVTVSDLDTAREHPLHGEKARAAACPWKIGDTFHLPPDGKWTARYAGNIGENFEFVLTGLDAPDSCIKRVFLDKRTALQDMAEYRALHARNSHPYDRSAQANQPA